MIKRLILAFALLAGLLSPAYSAGSISLSLSQQFDSLGKPLNGGKIYFIQAGTTSTPQNAYQDSALTIPHPNPLTLDSAGRVPQLFFADGNIKVRITSATGVNQLTADNIMVVGASSGGGGGGTVDPTTIIATGDIKARYGTGALSGFVRANGRTIGSATSGATERANLDCQALFEYLWGEDANLTVSTGRGVSANADWVANKTIALPDLRGRVIAGMDDMGNTSANLLSTMNGHITLGGGGGEQRHTLTAAELAPHTHSGTTGAMNQNASHSHTYTAPGGNAANSTAGGAALVSSANVPNTTTSATNTDHSHNFTTDAGTGLAAAPHNVIQPTIVMTYYQKL